METRPPARRILVIRLGAMGDVVRTLPAVSGLRGAYPDAQITWLVEPPSASILEGQPWVDEVLLFPRRRLTAALKRGQWKILVAELRKFIHDLRSREFDLVVDFHSILKSGVLSWLSRAPVRVGYARPFGREGAWLLATHRAELAPRKGSRFERNEALLRFLGTDAALSNEPLVVSEEALERAKNGLRDVSRGAEQAEKGWIAIHPGTSDSTPYKRYTVEGYAEVARQLEQKCGLGSLITCGPARDDVQFADAIVAAAGGAARLAPPTASLQDLAALFAQCSLYIGSDTGPMHVASLVGTPVVQLMGPTDPVENQPYSHTPSRTVRVPLPCSPCRRGCAAATCMKSISPGTVLEAAQELLAEPSPG